MILVDLEDPTQKRYMAGGQTSQEVLEWLHQRKQQVNQLELLAVLCASMTFKEKMLGREVIFYIDNTSALSAYIHGYCQAPDMGMLSNALALMLAGWRAWRTLCTLQAKLTRQTCHHALRS